MRGKNIYTDSGINATAKTTACYTHRLLNHVVSPAMYSLDWGVEVVALLNISERYCTTLSGVRESPSTGICGGWMDNKRYIKQKEGTIVSG